MNQVKSIEWICETENPPVPGHVKILDQRKLPDQIEFIETRDTKQIWNAIRTLSVRGAPAIGIAAAMGVAASIQEKQNLSVEQIIEEVEKTAQYLAGSRPTAVNLFWALKRMRDTAEKFAGSSAPELVAILTREAMTIRDEDAAMCKAIGRHGCELLSDPCCVLTHCNAGGLATSEFGTALAPIYTAIKQGRNVSVYADETRPLLQGARLTTWELLQAGVDVTLICDSTAAQVMKEGKINAVLVGADRIAANGDTANKIGTYSLSVQAKSHGVPFYVLAPTSTIDTNAESGKDIPIEERDSAEITRSFGMNLAPEGVKTYAPAFDVTPAQNITAIVCEKGVARQPYNESLKNFLTA